MRVLIIEDRRACAAATASVLRGEGFTVDHVRTLGEADDAVAVMRYDAVVGSRALPDGDGLDWVRAQRLQGSGIPILITGAEHGSVDQKVECLNAGADDYLPKPLPFNELVARLRAVLRRSVGTPSSILRIGNVAFDTTSREVRIADALLSLPRRETCILELLVRRSGKTVTKRSLEDGLYSFGADVSSNAIEVGIYRLRGHLARAGATVRIRTFRGVGYVFEEAPGVPIPPVVQASGIAPIPETMMMAAQVAMAMTSRAGLRNAILPAMAATALTAPEPGIRVAIIAAALAASMSSI